MISLTDIHIGFGGRPILKGVNLNVMENERVAIVGPNGCGKSTLLRIIARLQKPDQGNVSQPSRVTLGYLPQEANLEATHSLRRELMSAFGEVRKAIAEMRDLEVRMAETEPGSAEHESVLRRYSAASAMVEHRDGYALDSKIQKVAAGLGFTADDMSRSCSEFSGGWQMRILLAKLLLSEPDVMLLDEPTNHLDLESLLWLEEWIRNCRRTVIMVSHERAFMDRLVGRIVCLEMGQADVYRGGYSHYVEQSRLKREAAWKAYDQQRSEIEKTEAFIRKFRYNAARAAQVQSRIKQLEKIERIEPPFRPTAIHFNFPPAPPSHGDVVTLKGLGHSYGDKNVFSDANLTIRRGEKIGLVGVNGAGKSTLLRILAGREIPTAGECVIGGKVNRSYFAQYDTASLTSNRTLLEAIEAVAPPGQATRARDLLGAFLFSGDDVDKPLSALSGGERTRFRLAEMLFSPANLLLLDEPTNHLDVTSRATVESALQSYTGTVIVVSHDRVFMDKVTNRIIDIEDGSVSVYPGRHSDYLVHKQRLLAQQMGAPMPEEAPLAVPAQSDKEQRKRDYEERKALSRKTKSLERKAEALESEIASTEARIAELDTEMANPAVARDYGKLAPLAGERDELQKALSEKMSEWESIQQDLETLTSQ